MGRWRGLEVGGGRSVVVVVILGNGWLFRWVAVGSRGAVAWA